MRRRRGDNLTGCVGGGWMAPESRREFCLCVDFAGEDFCRRGSDSAELRGLRRLSSSALSRGSFSLSSALVVAGRKDPRLRPEDDSGFASQSGPSGPRSPRKRGSSDHLKSCSALKLQARTSLATRTGPPPSRAMRRREWMRPIAIFPVQKVEHALDQSTGPYTLLSR